MIFQSLLKKRTGFERQKTFDLFDSEIIDALIEPVDYQVGFERQKTFNLFNSGIIDALIEPVDYQVGIQNKKELLMRLIYIYFSKNDIINALHIFLYTIHYYKVSSSFLWRTGFHILLRIGDEVSMYNFFNAMLDSFVWDPSNMIYEYFLYLLDRKDYIKVQEIYLNEYFQIYKNKRISREPEMEKLHRLIKLTVAVSFYASWKQSLMSGREDDDLLLQADIEFKELIPAIEDKLVVDGYVLNYLEILEYQQKFETAFDMLRLYQETCSNNLHATEYLLDFMIRNKQNSSSITEEHICEIRAQFIAKQVLISPHHSPQFVLQAFKQHIEHLHEEGNHEELVRLLFKFLGDSRWATVEWPWRCLLDAVRHVGVESCSIRNSWLFLQDLWTDLFFSSPHNSYIAQLSQILRSSCSLAL